MSHVSPQTARFRLIGLLLAVAATSTAVAEVTARRLVGGQLTRAALTLVETQPVTTQALDTALVLLEQVVALNPHDAEAWRLLLRMGFLAENDRVRRDALQRLIKLAPRDDVVRLLYVNDKVDRYQTAEERVAFYRKLLSEPTRRKLGAAVASRLANDFAWLLDRTGDIDGFAHWIAEAVALDPSNRAAAATAAGFFRMNVGDDPFAEAELLTTLLLADPSSVDTQTVLARLLLENGAYTGADRMYRLAARTSVALRTPPASGLLADRVVAQWGRGDVDGALATIQKRQREADEIHRERMRQQDPRLTPLELARQHAPITPTLATTKAAIRNRRDAVPGGPALDGAIAAYRLLIEALETDQDTDPKDLAAFSLEIAFITLWLGGDVRIAQEFLLDARSHSGDDGLSPDAQARFDGWIALRRGEVDRAVGLLEPLAEGDVAARLGVAMARLAQGRRRDAAREFYRVVSSDRGTLVGVWAADVLAELLQQPVPISDTARRLERLIESIPAIVDRLPDEPTLAVSVRVQPAKKTFGPFEPVIVNLEITNNASFPLAIDPHGPIRSQVVLIVDVQVARMPDLSRPSPMVVDIDRRLRLAPNERLVIPVDLRRGALGPVLSNTPLRGATMKVSAITGFYVAGPDSIRPGILGSEFDSVPFRVDGVRPTREWIYASIAAVLDPQSVTDLATIGLLSQIGSMAARAREIAPVAAVEQFGDPRQVAEDTATAITEAYPKLDAVSRAWVLGAMTRTPLIEPVYVMARKDPDKLVRIAYLLYCLTGADDPMIDAARRGDDPDVRLVAEMMHDRISRSSSVP